MMEKATKTTPKSGVTAGKRKSAKSEHAKAAGQARIEVETREVETEKE